MKAIIIGSKGFIGKHLFRYFQGKGYNVWGADVIVDYVNLDSYYLIDASNSEYSSVFQSQKYDFCVNCSGAASVPDSLYNPMRDYSLNTVNVFKMLEAIRKYQPECRFVNLSSAAVYGNPEILPIKEKAILNPLSPYGFHKLQAEQICKEYNCFFKIPTCSLRIFSVYGEGLQKQLFWDLYKKVKTSSNISLFGNGRESRDFINVFDLVKAIDLVIEHSSFEADIINIANGIETMIEEVTSIFFSFFGRGFSYSFSGNSRKGDPNNWRADISKLNSFGYQQSVDLTTGLRKYYNWITDGAQMEKI